MYKYMYLENNVAIFKCAILIEEKEFKDTNGLLFITNLEMICKSLNSIFLSQPESNSINNISRLVNKFGVNIFIVEVVVRQ